MKVSHHALGTYINSEVGQADTFSLSLSLPSSSLYLVGPAPTSRALKYTKTKTLPFSLSLSLSLLWDKILLRKLEIEIPRHQKRERKCIIAEQGAKVFDELISIPEF